MLSTLHRLDHLSTCLRGNVKSWSRSPRLGVLRRERPVRCRSPSAPRSARSRTDKRVTVDRLPDAYLSPGVVSDLLPCRPAPGERGAVLTAPHDSGRARTPRGRWRHAADHRGPRYGDAGGQAGRGERPAGAPGAPRPGPDQRPRPVRGGAHRPSSRPGCSARTNPRARHHGRGCCCPPRSWWTSRRMPSRRPVRRTLGTRSRPERVPVPAPAGGPAPPSTPSPAPPPPMPLAGPAAAAPVAEEEAGAGDRRQADRPPGAGGSLGCRRWRRSWFAATTSAAQRGHRCPATGPGQPPADHPRRRTTRAHPWRPRP